jgi:DHA1 family multidrug resistance protein-like MFS transporter
LVGSRPAGSGSDRAWVRHFAAIVVCYLLTYCTIQLAYPFIALYLRELADSDASAIAWAGGVNTSMPLLIGLAAAFWGNVGDRFGLKSMAIRALVTAVVVFSATAYATQPWHVFVLFLFYGVAGSPPPAFSVLAAATLPLSRASTGMGLMQTTQFLGQSVGPLLGVLCVRLVGFRGAFQVSAAVMAVILAGTLLFVREPVTSRVRGTRRLSLREGLARVGGAPRLRAPMVAMLTFNAGVSAASSLLPLHVQRLAGGGGGGEVSNSVGVVLATTGLGTAVGSVALAWCAAKFGAGRVALLSLVLAGLFSVTCVWITDVAAFTAMRFLVGFCCGGVLPSLQSVLINMTAREPSVAANFGTVQGLSQTATWCGSALGSACGALLATQTSLAAIFALSGVLLLMAAVWWRAELRAQDRAWLPRQV